MAPKAKPKNTNQCQNLMLTALTAYYKKNIYNRKELNNIINGDSKLSLRLIDWFVTHYARVNSVIYWIDDKNGTICDNNHISTNKISESASASVSASASASISAIETSIHNLRKFNLYLDYRAQLQSYTKMFFDPFRRYSRISFVLENEPLLSIETTVGQLNFFRWALQNNVIEYIKNNITKIEESMANFQKQNQTQIKTVTSGTIQNNSNVDNNTNNTNNNAYTNYTTITNNTDTNDDTNDTNDTNDNNDNNDTNKNKTIRKTKLKTKQICHTHTISRVPCLVYFD